MRDWAHSRRLGTTADEAGSVVLRQPPASKLANLFRIDAWDHALGLVARQVCGRVTEHPPGGWLGPGTPSLREGPGSASVPSGSPDPAAGTGARVLGNEPSQLSPESTSYQPPRDVLGAVWSPGRGSLSGGKRRKTRCIGEADVRRTGEENAARRG